MGFSFFAVSVVMAALLTVPMAVVFSLFVDDLKARLERKTDSIFEWSITKLPEDRQTQYRERYNAEPAVFSKLLYAIGCYFAARRLVHLKKSLKRISEAINRNYEPRPPIPMAAASILLALVAQQAVKIPMGEENQKLEPQAALATIAVVGIPHAARHPDNPSDTSLGRLVSGAAFLAPPTIIGSDSGRSNQNMPFVQIIGVF